MLASRRCFKLAVRDYLKGDLPVEVSISLKKVFPPLALGQEFAAQATLKFGDKVQHLHEFWGMTRAEVLQKASSEAHDVIHAYELLQNFQSVE